MRHGAVAPAAAAPGQPSRTPGCRTVRRTWTGSPRRSAPAPSRTWPAGSGGPQNIATLFNDVHAAYQNALRWRISGDRAHGDAARDILNAWAGTLKEVTGSADRFLAAGLQGYQFANAAELMRGYPGFDLDRFKTMMLQVICGRSGR
ncbi:hypothetical protein ACFQ0T_09265 [Kitasatospora gansuensis]